MSLVLAFGVVLLISVSLSGVAARTVLSTALLFLIAGAALGPGGFGVDAIQPTDHIVTVLADLALFTVLFTDGQRASLPALRATWRLSGRALGLGMPLTMIGIALPGHYLLGLDWITALLIGAILSPNDCQSSRSGSVLAPGDTCTTTSSSPCSTICSAIKPAAAARAPVPTGIGS